jgi:hypothetical protein
LKIFLRNEVGCYPCFGVIYREGNQKLNPIGNLISDIQFNGQVGNLVAYRLSGEKEIVVRSKGSVPYKRYETVPDFALKKELINS